MKKTNLYIGILTSIIFLSCSNDNSESPNQNDYKVISEIQIKTFAQGEISSYLTRVYENNKPKTDSIFNNSNELILYTNWIYNNDKLVSRQSIYSNGMPSDELSITYDNFGRINQTIRSLNNSINTNNFIYNNDNTITSTSDISGVLSSKTFYLNEIGIINKEDNGNEIYLATYDNDNNIITLSTPFGISNFTYDNVNIPPTGFPVYEHFMLGDYQNNYIIYDNSLESAVNNSSSILVKYPLTRENGSDTTIIEWVLDSENYPTKRKVYIQNQLTIESDYIYN